MPVIIFLFVMSNMVSSCSISDEVNNNDTDNGTNGNITSQWQQVLETDKNNLTITYATGENACAVTQNVGLPLSGNAGSTITWHSNSPSVISETGTVIRPPATGLDAEVILTATLSYNDLTTTKKFPIVVLREDNIGEPTNIQTITGDGYATLTWDPPTDTGGKTITSYAVYQSTTSGAGISGTRINTGTANYIHLTGLDPEKQYYFVVQAVYATGEFPHSREIIVKPVSAFIYDTSSVYILYDGATNKPADITILPQWQDHTIVTEGTHYEISPPLPQALNFSTDTGQITGSMDSRYYPGTSYNIRATLQDGRKMEYSLHLKVKIKPIDRASLIKLLEEEVNEKGKSANMNFIDTGQITDMSQLFAGQDEDYNWLFFNGFTGDISEWDVRQVLNMEKMFYGAVDFNGDLSAWDVSNVKNMGAMFRSAKKFEGDLSLWDVGNVEDMAKMFELATKFNSDLSNWDVSKVTNMSAMFSGVEYFYSDLSGWEVGNVTNMGAMFSGTAIFNSDISGWDVSKVTIMDAMFAYTKSFNQDLSKWKVHNVTNMFSMFNYAKRFDQDIAAWDVGKVTNMWQMFANSVFNQDISGWNVDSVTSLQQMFVNAKYFDQDLEAWGEHLKGRSVRMGSMFSGAPMSKIPSWYND